MKTRAFAAAILLPAVFVGLSAAQTADPETIRLRPGFQKILDHPGVSRISIGNPEIIEAQPLPRGDGVIVVGKKEGETDLVVWAKGIRVDRKIEVRESNAFTAEEARAFAAGFPGVGVTVAGSSILVTGTVSTPQERKLWEDFAGSRSNIRLKLALPEETRSLLSYDLKIIEISKGVTSQIGLRWPDSVSAKGTWQAGGGAAPALAVAGDFETRLNLLLADGRARILANPRLVCETGESADFLAGGEIPIVIVTPETRTVEWKTYGILLKLQPKMDRANRIRTQITAEISTVDHGSGSSQVPAFLTRRVTTNVSSVSGGTVMLSGLVKSEMAKDVAKVPLLGQIPVLGELFKSRSFRESQSELAIFITPSEVKGDFPDERSSWDERLRKEREKMRFHLID